MNILNLTLKKEWFDMILSGDKKEEYREIKPHWSSRILDIADVGGRKLLRFKDFDAIKFTNGYAKNSPSFTIELKRMRVGLGRSEWGAEDLEMYYVFELGEIIKP